MAKKNDGVPDFVYPCGKKFKVIVAPIKCENTYGETDGIEKLITLDSSTKKKKHIWPTLYHEYLHAIFYCTGLSNLIGSELEEAIVVALEEHTYPLVDPKKLSEKP